MSGAGDALPDIREALARLRQGLDELTGTLGRLESPSGGVPAGELLGEEERRRLVPLDSLLAVSPGLERAEALLLLVDRAVHRAGADCAALFLPAATGDLEVVARRGLPPGIDRVGAGEGIVGRAFLEREVVRAGPTHRSADRLLGVLAASHALAVPVRLPGESAVGVLLACRRRAVPFEPDALETLVWLGDRAALVLGGRETTGSATALLAADLDLERTATSVVREAARRLGASSLALLLPDEAGVALAAGVGLPAGAVPPDLAAEPIAAALASGAPWVASDDAQAESLTGLLGAPGRLVVPLAAGERIVALLVAGGSGPLEPTALASFVAVAAAAIRNARLHAATVAALAELRALDRRPTAPPPAPVREFGNLLAILLARIALLRERLADHPAAGGDLAVAEEAAWRAAEAVRAFLGFAPGDRRAPLLPLDLGVVVRSAVEEAQRRWAARGGAPELELELPPLPPVRGSVEELREALDHLLENAAEAVLAGGPISVRASWDGGRRVEVVVRDGGVGMEDVARALQPFFSTKGPARLGLGLPVAQAIAARHRGSLEIQSALRQGTTARLALPTAAGTPVPTAEPEPGRVASRILVVEDESRVREALVELLAREGHVALAAADARQGLEILERDTVDVVVTAHAFADGSGLELARSVKRRHPDTPVILLTAWPGRLDPAVVLASGIDRVIEKPVGATAILAALDAALARRGSVGA